MLTALSPSVLRPVLLVLCALAAPAQERGWAGKWYTTRGVLELEVDDGKATGRYGEGARNTLEGEIAGASLTFTAREGRSTMEGRLERDEHSFAGDWRAGGNSGQWRGWREDPAARRGRAAKVAGAWRTSWGLLELEQKGGKLTGGYGAQGWSTVEGTIEGRHVELRYESPFGSGTVWFDVGDEGDSAFGAASSPRGDWPWILQRLEGYERDVKPRPGEIAQGLASNRLTYYLRAPRGWRKGTPMIVFLHGSNMSARPYVESIAATGDFGERFVIVGIDGERWQEWSEPDDPRHNYTYVNWMGKSTYEGYPNTHRESPALVAELLQDLKAQLEPGRVFVGGHSQGGYLSYFLLMHFPELIDGAFPMSCGLVIQCEPDVFDDAALKQAQRDTPLAIVHGERDGVVSFGMGQGAYRSFAEHGFPMLRLFSGPVGHGFSSLPWTDAVDWLEALSSDDADELLEFAARRLDEDGFRDVTAAVRRLRTMDLSGSRSRRVDGLAKSVDEYARFDAERLLEEIEADDSAAWIDGFLEFRRSFEFADCARPVMAAFSKLRAEHEDPARELFNEARRLFRQGDRTAGYSRYEKIVEECYASSLYTRVKGWLESR